MLRKALSAAGASLVLFHVWLLVGQAWAGQLVEPGRLLRWLVAAGLVALLVGLRRNGVSIFFGRKAVAIWLLAALLHGPAIADRMDVPGGPAIPQVAVTLAQIVLVSAAVGLGLLLGWRVARERSTSLFRIDRVAIRGASVGTLSSSAFLNLAPRPPPPA